METDSDHGFTALTEVAIIDQLQLVINGQSADDEDEGHGELYNHHGISGGRIDLFPDKELVQIK